MGRALDLSLVVPGSALHPITHCFVFSCPKFNSQAVLIKSLLVCPLVSWDLWFCNVYLQVLLGKWSMIIIIIIIVIEL